MSIGTTISPTFRMLGESTLRSQKGISTCNLQPATNSTGTDLVAALLRQVHPWFVSSVFLCALSARLPLIVQTATLNDMLVSDARLKPHCGNRVCHAATLLCCLLVANLSPAPEARPEPGAFEV